MNAQERFAEAKAALDAEFAATEAAALDEAANIPLVYDWVINWKSPHVFYCYKQLSFETIRSVELWKDAHPDLSFPGIPFDGLRSRPGMNYLLIHHYLVHIGGGNLILDATSDKDPFGYEPKIITTAERDALLAGVVPDSLKK